MKTETASFPSELPSSDMRLTDEVVFRHEGGELRVPLAVGLLLAANALRARETFILGYPGDARGRIARSEGGQLALHREVAGTINDMVAFLDRYGNAVADQVLAGVPAGAVRESATISSDAAGAAPPEEPLPPAA